VVASTRSIFIGVVVPHPSLAQRTCQPISNTSQMVFNGKGDQVDKPFIQSPRLPRFVAGLILLSCSSDVTSNRGMSTSERWLFISLAPLVRIPICRRSQVHLDCRPVTASANRCDTGNSDRPGIYPRPPESEKSG
jgi:hypothetical protein